MWVGGARGNAATQGTAVSRRVNGHHPDTFFMLNDSENSSTAAKRGEKSNGDADQS